MRADIIHDTGKPVVRLGRKVVGPLAGGLPDCRKDNEMIEPVFLLRFVRGSGPFFCPNGGLKQYPHYLR